MSHRPLGAQISHALKARGVSVIFGIPGVHNVEMYRGIEEAGITHVLARHEGGAAFMADGYARASGQPAVCYTITGPGVTNALTGLGQAYSDSVPVLCVASCLDETAARRGQLHQMRAQRAAALSVCDWAEEARTAEAAYALIDRAFAEFKTQRPRPKYLQVPIALAGSVADAPPLPAKPAPLPGLASTQLAEIVTVLLTAQKPLFVFGGGAVGAADVIPDVLRMTGAAAFMTYAGRGLVPPDTSLSFGSALARPSSAAVCAEADLIIAVGTELAEVDLWRETLGAKARIIRIDLDPEVLATSTAKDTAVHCDAAAALTAMAIAIPARVDDRAPCWDAKAVAGKRAEWRAEIAAERPGLVPVIDAVRAAMPDDAMIYSDMTQFAYAAKEIWDMPRAGHWHHPSGFGTLGYALPAAIGGKIARGDAPVVAIAGDYGFQYTVQELGTAAELGLNLPIILWDNGKLKEIEEAMVRSQIAPNAVVAKNPDFKALAAAYGAGYSAPSNLHGIDAAMKKALDHDGPTLVHLRGDVLIADATPNS